VAGSTLAQIKDPQVVRELRTLASGNSDGVMLDMLSVYSPAWLAGLLGAAIMACVMASDSQILALSTMWAEDVYRYYGGKSEASQVWSARAFVVVLTVAAYLIALAVHQYANIFEIAIQYAFSGYASMAPIMLACLFWKRSTKWGALAATIWVAMFLIGSAILQAATDPPKTPGAAVPILSIGDFVVLNREAVRISFTSARLLLVVPMFVGSALAMVAGSLLTSPPDRATIDRYFARSANKEGDTPAFSAKAGEVPVTQ
jgi:Na+/proline symporter